MAKYVSFHDPDNMRLVPRPLRKGLQRRLRLRLCRLMARRQYSRAAMLIRRLYFPYNHQEATNL